MRWAAGRVICVPLVQALNTALHGRGGGKPSFARGFGPGGPGRIEAFFAEP